LNVNIGAGTGTTAITNTTVNTTNAYVGALYINGNNIQTDVSARVLNGSLSLYTLLTSLDNTTVLRTYTAFVGDVTGAYSATVVGDDSHLHTKSTITINGENITAGTVAFARLPTLTNQILSSASNISAGSFGAGNFAITGNLSVSENITGVKCIVFANGFKVGSSC
jgi:hypothetical protein